MKQLREVVERQKNVPHGCILKIFQGAQLLADDVPIDRLDSSQPLFAVISRDTKLEVLLQASGSWGGYHDMLASAASPPDDERARVLGPMPTILAVLEDLGGQPAEMKAIRAGPQSLEYVGQKGDLLLPSLDATPLLTAAGVEKFARVTLSIQVNSDAFNRGLGVVLEANPLTESTPDSEKSFLYNGYGLKDDATRNVVKFHPGMQGGQLRIEGEGGWNNQRVGFLPKNWTASDHKFHTLEITVGADGMNEVQLQGTEPGEIWSKPWKRQLTEGRYTPAIYAWVDRVSECDSDPLHIGEINMRVNL